MSDIEGPLVMLVRVEALAESSPDWARTCPAHLLDEFRGSARSGFCRSALRALPDGQALSPHDVTVKSRSLTGSAFPRYFSENAVTSDGCGPREQARGRASAHSDS